MSMKENFIGFDISKNWIDMHSFNTGKLQRITTTKHELTKFAATCGDALVVLEVSGGYERNLCEALALADVKYARANPRHARAFAQARGCLSKTDRIDANSLADMGRALELTPTLPPDPNRARLADLVARQDIFGYIEMFYIPKRKHAKNGMLSPVDFENCQRNVNQEGV